MQIFKSATRGVAIQEGVKGMEGNIKWKLSEVGTMAVSRGQNKLIGKLNRVVGDVISIRG